ncbi:MAG: LD-carboxypeptidase [Thermoplasmatales archaeon]|nr:LD-carboxypeptidase [Thermoplasmatales archaeon]MCW6170115.1 LD-carboxypeptidase [Thermoplasmatales archaeon]
MKPSKLKNGANIRIIAPASAPSLRSLTIGVSKLTDLGYRVTLGDNIRKTKQIGYLSASDQDRANELNRAFADDSVDAVFCARGGYGSLRILPLIDFDIIKDHPKIFVGYSDITALHMAIGKKTDLITFHGPMPGVDFEQKIPKTIDEMFKLLRGETLDLTPQISRILGTVVEGETSGISAGTNFSLVTSLFGTEFQLIPNRRILFLEDVATSILDIDRYMAELLLSKTLYQLKGMVFGDFVEIPREDWPVPSLKEVIYNYVNKMKKPIIYGMPFGHGEDQMTIPLNAEIRISTEDSNLVLLEDVVD